MRFCLWVRAITDLFATQALLVLPKMRETREGVGKGENGTGVLSFVGSFTHEDTSFPERKAGNIFEELNREEGARMGDR